MQFYCRKLHINDSSFFQMKGPLLIAANHPNSFLDAIIIATLFKRPIYSLVRGDVYANQIFARILNALKMMPVYRISEGSENLDQNYNTFSRCRELFKENAIVLIFSEGRCINEWKLRPLKKGTARLAISTWEQGIDLKILPLGINYHSFNRFGKNIILNAGPLFGREVISTSDTQGKAIAAFNEKLKCALEKSVIQTEKNNTATLHSFFYVSQPVFKKVLLFFPAIAGYLIHIIPYLTIKYTIGKKFRNNDHYDSVITAALFFIIPIWWLSLALAAVYLSIPLIWILIFLMPICGWSYIQLKNQF